MRAQVVYVVFKILPIPRTKLLLFLDMCKYITIFIPLRDNPPYVLLLPVVWQIPLPLHLTPYTLHQKKSHKNAISLAYITQKHYFCIKIYSSNYGTQILSSLWCRVYLPAWESRQVPMCRRGTLSLCSCSSGSTIPQPMPLPQVPIGVLCLSNVCLLSRIYSGIPRL